LATLSSKNGTCPVANSKRMHPRAHISVLYENIPSSENNSGAV